MMDKSVRKTKVFSDVTFRGIMAAELIRALNDGLVAIEYMSDTAKTKQYFEHKWYSQFDETVLIGNVSDECTNLYIDTLDIKVDGITDFKLKKIDYTWRENHLWYGTSKGTDAIYVEYFLSTRYQGMRYRFSKIVSYLSEESGKMHGLLKAAFSSQDVDSFAEWVYNQYKYLVDNTGGLSMMKQ